MSLNSLFLTIDKKISIHSALKSKLSLSNEQINTFLRREVSIDRIPMKWKFKKKGKKQLIT